MNSGKLDQLRQLAELRTGRSAASLAEVQTLLEALEAKARELRGVRPDAPASISEGVMRDKWDRWRLQQLRDLNRQIARLNAIAEPRRNAYARDRAREAVLGRLADRGKGSRVP